MWVKKTGTCLNTHYTGIGTHRFPGPGSFRGIREQALAGVGEGGQEASWGRYMNKAPTLGQERTGDQIGLRKALLLGLRITKEQASISCLH